MLKVGITGGIGSGKTTVCQLFSTLGIPVYYADMRAKELMVEDIQLKTSIKLLVGSEAYFSDGRLNRKFIAEKVFQQNDLLLQLNALVHPAVFLDTQQWYHLHRDKTYTLYETAILFESGSYQLLDKIITVYSPIDLRMERTMLRDGISETEVMDRIKKQLPEEDKMKRADFIIYNDLTKSLIEQVLAIHQQLITLDKTI